MGQIKVRYNPALDGVRAIAITLVLVTHAYHPAMPGGGVDVFFVLSGYLITSILLHELTLTGQISISYGLYLYHWPVFILGESWKIYTPFHLYAVALIALIFAIAALSFEFVEKPFLKLKDRFNWRVDTPLVVPSARAA